MSERTVARGEAIDALIDLAARQRLLRTSHAVARYGWPETHASAWASRPQTFTDEPGPCRVTAMLEALANRG